MHILFMCNVCLRSKHSPSVRFKVSLMKIIYKRSSFKFWTSTIRKILNEREINHNHTTRLSCFCFKCHEYEVYQIMYYLRTFGLFLSVFCYSLSFIWSPVYSFKQQMYNGVTSVWYPVIEPLPWIRFRFL